ncbi:MAG: NADH-quinone oxidoreductase subunit C [Methanomassiliicoccales archaeon]|nr:NADH-quinone oxidoreductase subunit C [Methanomassiliicoccales archaeon]
MARRIVDREGWLAAAQAARLVALWGTDRGAGQGFAVAAAYASAGGLDWVELPLGEEGRYPDLSGLFPYAARMQRATADLVGLAAEGAEDTRPWLSHGAWTRRMPLRQAAPELPQRDPADYPFVRVAGDGVHEIPVGPVHAGVIEPGHFRFSVAGEPIINLELRLGYVHKGIEKLSERMLYRNGVQLSERISGDNGFAHSLAYCQAVEALSDVEVPERSKYLRCIFAELERIHNHLGDVGGIALDTAFSVGAQRAYTLRERMMDVNDLLTGSRFLRGVNCLGGVTKDIDEALRSRLMERLVQVKLGFQDYHEEVIGTPSIMDRLETTGVLPYEAARDLNIVGPGGRASGVDRDVRRDHPYAAYRNLSFRVPILRQGDVNARFQIKSEEIFESISIVEQAVSNLPDGELRIEVPSPDSGRTAMSLVESPRGELMHWIVSGEGRPFRHKIRDASFHNWRAMEVAVLGNIVPDFPLVNKSFSLSYSGNDL